MNVTGSNLPSNLTAKNILEATTIVSSNGEKQWSNMSFAEKTLQVLSFGLWSPKYSQEQKEQAKDILSKLIPVQPMIGEAARAEARFSDYTVLTVSLSPGEDITASIIGNDGIEKVKYFDGEHAEKIKHSLPFPIHKPYLMKHHVPNDMEIVNTDSMRNVLNIAAQYSTSIVKPHTSDRNPLAGTSPFSSVFMDAHRALGAVNIAVDGMQIPLEAQLRLSSILGLDSKQREDTVHALTPSEATSVVNLCSGTDEQCNNLYELLTCSSGITALCSSFFQAYPLPILSLNQEHVISAAIYSAEHGMNLPNSCVSVSISTTTQDGSFLVTNNTGMATMSPNHPGEKIGLLLSRTEYTVPNNTPCNILSMIAGINPKYSGSTIFSE